MHANGSVINHGHVNESEHVNENVDVHVNGNGNEPAVFPHLKKPHMTIDLEKYIHTYSFIHSYIHIYIYIYVHTLYDYLFT